MEGHPYYRERENLDSQQKGLAFDAEQALRYVKEIAFPRKTGSEGEGKAAQILLSILKELGYEVREEDFSVDLPPWLWVRSPFLFPLFFLFLIWITFEKIPFLGLLLSSAFLLWVGVWDRIWIRLGDWVVSEGSTHGMGSKNILAKIPGSEEGKTLYLVAHYDSKSQSLSLYLRTGIFLLGCVAGGIFSLWIWVHAIQLWTDGSGFSMPTVIQVSFFLAAGLNLLLLFSKMGNESAGALDNASGVGVLLEVARNLILLRPKKVGTVFLFTGGEEMGLLGSLMFRKRYGKEMVRNKSFLINIDSVGRGRRMKLCSSRKVRRRWFDQFRLIAKERGIQLRPLPFHKGVFMDHLPFCHLNLLSFSLTSIFREGWDIHTARDRISSVEKGGLEEMGGLILALIESFEKGEAGLIKN